MTAGVVVDCCSKTRDSNSPAPYLVAGPRRVTAGQQAALCSTSGALFTLSRAAQPRPGKTEGPSDTHLGAPHPDQRRQSPGLVTAGTASCQLSGAARGEASKVRRKEWWGWVAVPSVDSGGVGVSVSSVPSQAGDKRQVCRTGHCHCPDKWRGDTVATRQCD